MARYHTAYFKQHMNTKWQNVQQREFHIICCPTCMCGLTQEQDRAFGADMGRKNCYASIAYVPIAPLCSYRAIVSGNARI